MKKIIFFLITFLLVSIFACKDDDNHSVIQYKNYAVVFYNTHKDFDFTPPEFTPFTETILIKPAHLQGATFNTVTEIILIKPNYTKLEIKDSTTFHIVANSKTDSVTEVTCYKFYDEDEFIEVDVPAEYQTIIKYELEEQGNGSEIPAEYMTVNRIYMSSPGFYITQPTTQQFKRVVFKIPEGRSIQAHLGYSFQQYGIEHCEEGHSYRVVE